MATKRVRNGTWHFTVRRKGLLPKPIYLSFATEEEGDRYCKHLESLLDHGIVPREFAENRGKPKTIAKAIVEYTDAEHISKQDAPVLELLRERVGKIELTALTYAWCSEWVSSMKRKDHLAPSTIRHYVGALARCIDWCCRHEYMPGNPLRALPKRYATYNEKDASFLPEEAEVPDDEPNDRRLEPGEHERILRVLKTDYVPDGKQRGLALEHREALTLMYWWAIRAGMRLSEMYTLTTDQVDAARRTIFLDRTKNGSKRQVPMFPEAVAAWESYSLPNGASRVESENFVFPWWSGGDEAERRRVTSLLSRQWARIFAQAGCAGLTFHALRHEATCWVYLNTQLSDVQIAKMMGWKSLKMALRYANLRGSDLAMLAG